jgi:hemoglobin
MAHIRLLDIEPAHFERWLTLFRETVIAECHDAVKQSQFITRAALIGEGIKRGVSFYRQHDPNWQPVLLG